MTMWRFARRPAKDRIRSVVAMAVVGILASLSPVGVATAGVSSDGVPIDILADGESTHILCTSVRFEHFGVFSADNNDHDNTYGFIEGAQGTWTFSPGIREFEFLTWGHGDIDDPDYEFETFTVEAYDNDENLVDTLEVRDVDGVFADYELFTMSFDEPVVEIRVSFTAYYELAVAASGFIPFLAGGADCPHVDGDRYLEWLETRPDPAPSLNGLPDTR